MLIEDAIVVGSKGKKLWVQARARSACSACNQTSCSSSALATTLKTKPMGFEVENSMHAKVGDAVVIGIDDSVLLRFALLGYFWPLASMIGVAVLAKIAGFGELGQFLIAVSGLLVGFGLLKVLNKRQQRDCEVRMISVTRYNDVKAASDLLGEKA